MKLNFGFKTKRFKVFFERFFRAMGEHFFLSFLIIVTLTFIFGGVVFYRYIFLAENTTSNVLEVPVFFNMDIYKKVLEELQNREQTIQELNSKQYSNPFQIPVPVPNETIPG